MWSQPFIPGPRRPRRPRPLGVPNAPASAPGRCGAPSSRPGAGWALEAYPRVTVSEHSHLWSIYGR